MSTVAPTHKTVLPAGKNATQAQENAQKAQENAQKAQENATQAPGAVQPVRLPRMPPLGIATLTSQQRRLVEENIGLVVVHLKRFISARQAPKHDREWDDLFQEGCIGLSRAAAHFNPESGIAFAAYAIRRIQNAVHRAFFKAFATVNIPRNHFKIPYHQRIKVYSLNRDVNYRDNEGRRRERYLLNKCHSSDTIGATMRRIYEHAVRKAASMAGRYDTQTTHRSTLLKRIVDDRLLIPSEDLRTPLRVIARQTRSHFSNVLYTERRLIRRIRYILKNDPEFCDLMALAWRRPEGYEAVLPSYWPDAGRSVSGNVR